MTWRDVVGRDLTSAYRARTIPGVFVSVLLTSVGIALLMLYLGSSPPTGEDAVMSLGMILSLVIPIVGLWGAYGAIVIERTSGSVRFLMGLPNSRLDAYLGKYVSRSAIVIGSVAVGTLLTGIVVWLWYEGGSFLRIAELGGLTVLYALVFVGIGLAISTLFDTESRASSAMIGVFMAFRFGWPALQYVGLRLAEVSPPMDDYPVWYFLLGRVNPMNAYNRLVGGIAGPDVNPPLITRAEGVETVATSHWFAFLVLVAWAVGVPILGYLRFRRMDLL